MGFDIKRIDDILLCPAQYFCPLCRTLVNPNEALQTQCTHLYCKPCLTEVANGSGACPYDGTLVIESNSMPLVESDKDLAEEIGNIKVRCLFDNTGCIWEGTLLESNDHCDGCFFGELSVVCKWCGVQHLNKEASEHGQYREGSAHAQCCRDGYIPQQAATGSSEDTALTDPSYQQDGHVVQQAETGEVNATGSSGNVVLTDTSHQQGGYDMQQAGTGSNANTALTDTSYQQVSSSDKPLAVAPVAAETQEQPAQQYQQQSVPVHVQNQLGAHAAPQPHTQDVPPVPSQAQVPPQDHDYLAPIQSSTPNYQLPHLPTRPQTQLPSQMLPPPSHGEIVPHSQPMAVTPSAQHHQMPQYQNSPVQMRYPPQSSQALSQPQMCPPLQRQPPSVPQMHPGNQSYGQGPPVQPYVSHSRLYARLPPPSLENPDSMKHKDLENRDAGSGSSKVLFGGLSSADLYKHTLTAVWKYRYEGSSGTASLKDHDRERLNPFSVDATRTPYHSSGYNVNSSYLQNSDAASRPGSGVSSSHSGFLPSHGVGSHHGHLGVSANGYGEGFRSFNPSSDPTSFDHLQRGSTDGSRSTGDHNMSSMHTTGSSNGTTNSYPGQGHPNALGGPESLDLSRKRPGGIAWCRLCRVDCETMQKLDLHSQSNEHQKIALDIVKTIKEQNKKKHTASTGHSL